MSDLRESPPERWSGVGWSQPEDISLGKEAERRQAERAAVPPVLPPMDAEPERRGGWFVPREALERASAIIAQAKSTEIAQATVKQPEEEPKSAPQTAISQPLPPNAARADEADYSRYIPGRGFVPATEGATEPAPAESSASVVAQTTEMPVAQTTDLAETQTVPVAETQTVPESSQADSPTAEMAPITAEPALVEPAPPSNQTDIVQRFRDVEREVAILRRKYKSNMISKAEAQEALRRLMIELNGVWWMVGFETDAWFKYDGKSWVMATPPGLPPRSGNILVPDAPDQLRAPKVATSEQKAVVMPEQPKQTPSESAAGAQPTASPSQKPASPLPKQPSLVDEQGTVVGKWASRLAAESRSTNPTVPNRLLDVTQPHVSSGATVPNPVLSGQTVPAGSPASLQQRAAVIQAPVPKGSVQPDYGIQPRLQDSPERIGGLIIRMALVALFAVLTGLLLVTIGTIIFYLNIIGRYEARIAALGRVIDAESQSVQIFDASGRLIHQMNDPNLGARRYAALSEISPYMIHATVATEDKRFYENPGFDLIAMFRAILQNFASGETISGASSITQQLVRAKVLDASAALDRSVGRKIDEVIVASEVHRRYSKSQILEFYLNTVYYGNLAYGVEAAAQTYFKKSAKDLNLAEASFLAGLVQAPATYDPAIRPPQGQDPAWLIRMREVQRLMAEAGCIRMEHAPYNGAPFCVTQNPSDPSPNAIASSIAGNVAQTARIIADMVNFRPTYGEMIYPHFVVYVRQLLEAQFGQEALYTSGFSVYTTIDPRIQDAAQAALSRQIAALARQNVRNGALLAVRPSDGAILAMVGSVDFNNAEIDGQVNVTLAPRQPGSALKPFVYLTAMERDAQNRYWTPATVVWDVQTCFGTPTQPYCPRNYDNTFHGPQSVRSALANSYNVPAVKALAYTGIERFKALAGRVGINFPLTQPEQAGLATALGAAEVTMLDLVRGYSVLANGGNAVPLHAISRITRKRGGVEEVVFQYQPPAPTQVVEPGLAYLITHILSDNAARTPAFGANSPLLLRNGHTAAVKTGTTDNNRDNWTVGYTPQVVVGVWVGNTRGEPMIGTSGITGAAPIWNEVMTAILANTPPQAFPVPPNVGQAVICADFGTQDFEGCVTRRPELVFAPNPPPPPDSIFRRLRVDTFSNLLANEFCPEYIEEKVFLNIDDPSAFAWLNNTPQGQAWARQRNLELPLAPPPTEACRPGMERPNVSLASPLPQSVVNGVVQIVGTISMPNFARYEIELGVGHSPIGFTRIDGPYTQQPTMPNTVLGGWDSRTRPDGPYTLRLVVFDQQGRRLETSVPIFVQNTAVQPTAPLPFFVTETPSFFPTSTPEFIFPTAPPFFPPTATPIPIDNVPPFFTPGAPPTATPPISIFPPTQAP
ncbi:MAG: transglycosylase domain-containing protein [Anaerolineae bacterium]|nr:transglycosylase domain-containing protein [Anaerolineae bacterium]